MVIIFRSITKKNDIGDVYSWEYFVKHVLPTGEVKKVIYSESRKEAIVVLHNGAIIDGRPLNHLKLKGFDSIKQLQDLLHEEENRLRISHFDHIKVEEVDINEIFFNPTALMAFLIVLLSILIFLPSQFRKVGQKFTGKNPLSPKSNIYKKVTGIKFHDVAGMQEAKQEVMEFVHFLKEARTNSPCIVFIDEVDAVGQERKEGGGRGDQGSTEYAQTLNQILVEMDGMFSSNHAVIVMASTNRPDRLDKALMRPGRFDRHIYIDLPTLADRIQIFEIHLSSIKTAKDKTAYSEKLARLTPGMSGADIANVCNEAAIYAAREKDDFVDEKHFDYAIERNIAGLRKKNSPLTPKDKLTVSVHESGHALVGWLLEHTDALMKVSIVPHTKSNLGYTQMDPQDRKLLNQKQLFERMCMALGGRAAESLYFNTVTSGAEDDIKKVTDMAYAQVKHLGFSSKIGQISFGGQEDSFVRPYSDALQKEIDEEANKLVYSAYQKAKEILKLNKEKLNLLSKSLLEKETLHYNDIEQLIGPPKFGDKRQVTTVPFGPFPSEFKSEKSS